MIKKIDSYAFELCRPKKRDFPIFRFEAHTQTEISEIHQKPPKYWVCNFKNSLNTVQMTSVSKWSNHIANHAAANWVLKAFDPSEYIKLSLFFVYVSFHTQKVKIVVKTQIQMHCSVINHKIKIFRDFRFFVMNAISKNEKSHITEIHQKPKILKCEYATSQKP